jgi:hypothetical protein
VPLQPPVGTASPPAPVAPGPVTERPELATAVISSSPPAQVRVNGRFVGLSPVTLRRVPPGPVQVEVYDSVKGFAKVQTFILDPGDNGVLQVSVEQGSLELRIHPSAVVFLDDKRVGETPLGPISLYEGHHELRLECEELGKRLTTNITIEPRQTSVFKFNLKEEK